MIFHFSRYKSTKRNSWCAGHPWVQVDGDAPDRPLDSAVLSRLKQFSAMNKLKKMAIRVSDHQLFEIRIPQNITSFDVMFFCMCVTEFTVAINHKLQAQLCVSLKDNSSLSLIFFWVTEPLLKIFL